MSSETYLDNGLAEANNVVSRPQTSSEKKSWWKNALDKKEAKNQVLFSLPIILTTVFYYLITLVSVMFAGHLGELDLAGATLANSWAIVTGFGLMFWCRRIQDDGNLSTGFLHYIIVLFYHCISNMDLYRANFDLASPRSSNCYESCSLHEVPYSGVICIRLSAEHFEVSASTIYCCAPSCVLLDTIVHALWHCLLHDSSHSSQIQRCPNCSFRLIMDISFDALCVCVFGKKFKKTWNGVSLESFYYILPNLKLALPSAAMVCLEYWAFEILVFSAGLMPNPKISTSLMAICVNTEAVAFMLIYGLSAAASTRVSNELGAGNVDRAKKAMVVTLELSILLDLAMVLALVLGHNIWAGFFSDNHSIRKEFASMTPFLAISIILDSLQGILSGVARGCGWQNLAAFANLGAFYFIGMPIACVLGFKVKLHVKGLWIGLICGIFCQAAALSLITIRRKWTRADVSGSKNENPSPVVV